MGRKHNKAFDHSIDDAERYEYPQDEYVISPEASKSEPQSEEPEEIIEVTKGPSPIIRFILNNKRMVGSGILALILLIIFQVFNHGAPARVNMPSTPADAVVAQQNTAPEYPVEMLKQSLDAVRDTEMNHTEEIAALKNDILSLKDQLDELSTTNASLKQDISALSEVLKNIQATKTSQDKPVIKKQKSAQSAPAAPRVTYHIHAMVAGRAWLSSSDGLSQTVSVGDPIAGLGTVQIIDENRGVVVTSSGQEIHYAP